MSAVLDALRSAKHHATRLPGKLRDRFADPRQVVLMTPGGIGLGNFAYFWLQVTIQRKQGISCGAVRTEPMQPWLEVFPQIQDLLIAPDQIPLRATRLGHFWQGWDEAYDKHQLQDFVKEYLLEAKPFKPIVDEFTSSSDTIVINIRRGDYYSVPEFRGKYSFDVVEYLAIAVERSLAKEPIRKIVVVSDDPVWCKTKLDWLDDIAEVVYPIPGEPPATNLARLAGAQRLILANSTFSYWGGHLAGVRNPNAHVIAPRFHSRDHLNGAAFQLDPDWDIVEEIPGGWDG